MVLGGVKESTRIKPSRKIKLPIKIRANILVSFLVQFCHKLGTYKLKNRGAQFR
jgi:hypothetical protein